MARKQDGWHREEIKAALRKRYGAISALSASWGLDASAIANTLRRPLNSMRVERLISEALEVPLHELWPNRWAPDGTPLPRFNAPEVIRPGISPERQKREAA